MAIQFMKISGYVYGYIKSWKEKKSNKKIINYLIQEYMKINIEKNFIL
jgi:hypothetical protein